MIPIVNILDHILFRRAVPADNSRIAALQKANMISNLSEPETRDGFLSIEYSERQFEEINNDLAVVVAAKGENIVGYLCAHSFGYAERFPVLMELIKNLGGRTHHGEPLTQANTFIYGPVCIEKAFRGNAVLAGLFEALKNIARPRYAHCALFVSEKNPRSLKAHIGKVGMADLGTFTFDNRLFHILVRSL